MQESANLDRCDIRSVESNVLEASLGSKRTSCCKGRQRSSREKRKLPELERSNAASFESRRCHRK